MTRIRTSGDSNLLIWMATNAFVANSKSFWKWQSPEAAFQVSSVCGCVAVPDDGHLYA